MDNLAECLKDAWSIENMEAHGAAGRETKYIGEVVSGSRIITLYRDDTGAYWYSTSYATENGVISQEQAVFGERRIRRKKRK